MNCLQIIQKFYQVNSLAHKILVTHSNLVTAKALQIAKNNSELKPDLKFIEEAAMLHDIGVFLTDDQQIGCFGEKPYLAHGYLGRKTLEKENLPRHALVCERHVGVGITKQDIIKNDLPLPVRDMKPITIEEEIISLADKFFTKIPEKLIIEKSVEEILADQEKHGQEKVAILKGWLKKYKI